MKFPKIDPSKLKTVPIMATYTIPKTVKTISSSFRPAGARISKGRVARAAVRQHDMDIARWWRRLGFGRKLPALVWTVDDEISATLAESIRKEIDDEITKAIMRIK